MGWRKADVSRSPRPQYVDQAVEEIAGPGEQHEAEDSGTCINPKCHYNFTPEDMQHEQNGWITCPACGFEQQLYPQDNVPKYLNGELNPGGITRSGLTLKQMGDLGEAVVLRLGELPGIGTITKASDSYNFSIDAIVTSSKGKLGCEIKSNHSQAQERFKIGGAKERQEKIIYCLTNGMKPALIGVRLNFFTDKAYVFFREGLTDTWIGNKKMAYVGVYDFADINPFKSPDPQAQALAVENAHLPDQSEGDEFDGVFGKTAGDDDQPRDSEGRFTFKDDVHEIKVKDKKGKHSHTIKRCQHCGAIYGKHSEHMGRMECPSCGEDPERKLSVAKVVLAADNADYYAKTLGFDYLGRNSQGHRRYNWTDDTGINHLVQVGGGHGKGKAEMDAQFARQRMQKCLNGKCAHVFTGGLIDEDGAPGQPLFSKGQTVQTGGEWGIVLEPGGEASLVQNFQSGQKGWVPNEQLQATGATEWSQ